MVEVKNEMEIQNSGRVFALEIRVKAQKARELEINKQELYDRLKQESEDRNLKGEELKLKEVELKLERELEKQNEIALRAYERELRVQFGLDNIEVKKEIKN